MSNYDQLTIGVTKVCQKYGEVNAVEVHVHKDLQEVTALIASLKDMQRIGINVDDALEQLQIQENNINCNLNEIKVLTQTSVNTAYCSIHDKLLEFVTYIAKIIPDGEPIDRIKDILGGETNNRNEPSNGGHYSKNPSAPKPNYTLDHIKDLIDKFNNALEIVDGDVAKLTNLITLMNENITKGFKIGKSVDDINVQLGQLVKEKGKKYTDCAALLNKIYSEADKILEKIKTLERSISGNHTPLVFEE